METENGFLFEFYNLIRDFVITRKARIVLTVNIRYNLLCKLDRVPW